VFDCLHNFRGCSGCLTVNISFASIILVVRLILKKFVGNSAVDRVLNPILCHSLCFKPNSLLLIMF